MTRICFSAQNPGSLDEGFVPTVLGPVRDLATTPGDRVIVVFQNESSLDGDLVLFDRDGKEPIAASGEQDVWAARWFSTNVIAVIGRAPFWDTTDILFKDESDLA